MCSGMKNFDEHLRCPVCKHSLMYKEDEKIYYCNECGIKLD